MKMMATKVEGNSFAEFRFPSLEAIQEVDGYVEWLGSGVANLSEIIGDYSFKEKIHCGVNRHDRPGHRCNTLHNNGVVIRTTTGQVTCCGGNCGKNYFGDEYENAKTSFDAKRKRAQDRVQLNGYVDSAALWVNKITAIKQRSQMLIDRIKLISSAILGADNPELKRAFAALKKDQGIIRVASKKSEDDFFAGEGKGNNAHLEVIETIEAISVHDSYLKVAEKIDSLDVLVKDLQLININVLGEKEIEDAVLRFKNVSADFVGLENFIIDAERHLRAENLKRFIALKTQISRGDARKKGVVNALEVVIPGLGL